LSVTDIHIAGYRSVHRIRFPVGKLSVLVGGNGVGKTNLYRSLELLQAAALGTLSEEIAREGGLASLLWAGPRLKTDEPRLILEATLDGILKNGEDETVFNPTYHVEIGFPDPISEAALGPEAQIRVETVTVRAGARPVTLMERRGPSAWARNADGARILAEDGLLSSETALSRLRGGYPEIDAVRYALSEWRFYHGFRTDPDSPLRRPALAVTSPMLHSDGSNLAAVFATLRFIRGDTVDLDAAIDDAFPGARLLLDEPARTTAFSLAFPDLPHRPFGAGELSDGTLHFLALMGALLAYRLPPFIALNEPETSLHPDLLPALARTIARAAMRTQVWVVTHSRELAEALAQETGVLPRQVVRKDGGTWLEGLNQIGLFIDE